jgi:uncharacterized DUF497 family protein
VLRTLVAFEFDPAKSVANLAKHGIDFEAAQSLWLDDDAVEIDARSETEPRSAVIGKIGGRYWIAFVTMRTGSIRIISVRRARDNEVEIYERQKDR